MPGGVYVMEYTFFIVLFRCSLLFCFKFTECKSDLLS